MSVALLLIPKKKSIYMTFFSPHYFIDNQKQIRYNTKNRRTSYEKKIAKYLLIQKKYLPLHPQSRNKHSKSKRKRKRFKRNDGPFVYRLGRKIFILERGVRLPHGLQLKK